jgi:16S rRNA (uracil1498-N3)-methyltransferase
MQLFYNPNIDESTRQFSFDKDESKHIVKVLRKQIGDTLNVTNGRGLLWETQIELATPSNCTVKCVALQTFEQPKKRIHLAVAPTKMMDRMEWLVEKATEIGITSFTPLICSHSERDNLKIERLEKIALSAMKQSKQFYLPEIKTLTSFEKFVSASQKGDKFVAHCIENEKQPFEEKVKNCQEITILIGPEGDFTEKEIQLALSHQFQAVSLGQTRLRTETAALVSCVLAQFS